MKKVRENINDKLSYKYIETSVCYLRPGKEKRKRKKRNTGIKRKRTPKL